MDVYIYIQYVHTIRKIILYQLSKKPTGFLAHNIKQQRRAAAVALLDMEDILHSEYIPKTVVDRKLESSKHA